MADKSNIYVIGDSVVGAMVAAYFAKNLPSDDYDITFFDDQRRENSNALYSSLHSDSRKLVEGLQLKEAHFISKTDAVFSLGEKNFGGVTGDYINTYCPYGLSLEGIDFLSVMQQLGETKSLKQWEDYNLAASMIRQGKFNPPDIKNRPIISDFSYGYQLDAEQFHKLLRSVAVSESVIMRDVKEIKRCYFDENKHGLIEFSSGEVGQPKLIIDASSDGFFVNFDEHWQASQSWDNSFLEVRTEPSSNFENHVSHRVSKNTIETQINLQSKTLTLSINDLGKGMKYKLGRLQQPWINNVVHLGKVYGLLPIMGAPLRINQIAIERLLALFPTEPTMISERREYNRLMTQAFDRFEDFQSLWLRKSGFRPEADIILSDDAAYRHKLFQARGRLPNFDDDLFFQDQWESLFLGQDIWPEHFTPLAHNLSDDTIKKFTDGFRSIVRSAISQMPSTSEFVTKHAATSVSNTSDKAQNNDNKEQAKISTMTSNQPIKSVVIAGGGTAGWMTAAALAKTLGETGINITLVESEAIGTVGVGEATIPNIATFNAMLGIDEASFMKATQATIKYGIEFVDWTRHGDSYFHPFGQHGHAMAGLSFHHIWHKLYTQRKADRIENYCATAMAAKHGKACLPARDPNSVMSSLSHAYQFDAGRYASFLRQYAEKLGVKRIEGKITDVDLDVESGFIKGLGLENNKNINADFFIDCTGFRALLTNKALEVGYNDWSHWLPCNSAQAISCEKAENIVPYTRATALKAGWQWRIPLQHRTGNGYVYASDYISDKDAADILLQNLDGEPLGAPKQLRFTTGQRKKIWHKNCVAIGLSAGFLEPLESTSIYLIQAGISRLLALFPDQEFNDIESDEYNTLMSREFEQVRDFLILHYIANERHGEPFWDYVRNMSIPESLQRKIDLFKHRGRFFRYDGDLFSETSWVAVFFGQNIIPAAYNPLVDGLPERGIEQALASLKSEIDQNIPRMPSHDEFLSRYCAAPDQN